jgi:hypothetical protein
MIDKVGLRIAIVGLLAGMAAGAAPVMAQELPIASFDRQALVNRGFTDPSLLIVLDSKGEVVGALTEGSDPNDKVRGLPMSKVPTSLSRIRGLGSIAILAFEGSNCYVVRRPDGTLYVMPPGCQ